MGILVECPLCHRKQSTKNKHCAACGDHLDKQKRNGKARYWVVYRIAGRNVESSPATPYRRPGTRRASAKGRSVRAASWRCCRSPESPLRSCLSGTWTAWRLRPN